MKCDICKKERLWLIFIGKDNVCSSCIAKHTVFKEVKESDEIRLRLAMRSFPVRCFDDLKKIKDYEVDELKSMPVRQKQTFKFKKNKASAVKVDGGDTIDPLTEQDQLW